jgi:hypothetical protein
MTTNVAVNWFEIPATDLDRAERFYTAVFGGQMLPMQAPDGKMLAFQNDGMPVGALIGADNNQPGDHGPLVYLDAQGDIDARLSAVEAAGGSVALPRTDIGDYGAIAQFIDSEGNRVALHTR